MFGALDARKRRLGQVAALADIPRRLSCGGWGAHSDPLLWRWKLNIGADLDLARLYIGPIRSCQPKSMPIEGRSW